MIIIANRFNLITFDTNRCFLKRAQVKNRINVSNDIFFNIYKIRVALNK
jgi:hypothetical protein